MPWRGSRVAVHQTQAPDTFTSTALAVPMPPGDIALTIVSALVDMWRTDQEVKASGSLNHSPWLSCEAMQPP